MGRAERWFVCPKCGVLGITSDPHYSLFRCHCKWCDLAPRWLTPDELAALKEHPSAAEAVRAGRNVNMQHEEGRWVVDEWGARSKSRAKAHFRSRGPKGK
jgi:hypothetical protein